MNLRPAIYTPWPAVAPWRRRLRPLLLSTFAFLLSTFLALPSASAFEWQNSGIWDSDSVDRAFDSGPAWFTAGPSWMMNAMPGSHFRARVLARSVDAQESTSADAPYVGTLHDVFDVSAFNNVSIFAIGSGSTLKLSQPVIQDSGGGPLAPLASDLYWDTNGTTANSGTAIGTWGTSNFWNSDSTGGAGGAFQTATTNVNDVHFSAGTTAGPASVNISGAQSANSIFFAQSGNLAVNSGTSITLGGGGGGSPGITFVNGVGLVTINTPLILASSAETFTHADNSGQTITGGITSSGTSNLTININSTGALTISGTSINNTGTILNSGSGSGDTIISANIGSNVTGITQNTTGGSDLILSGTNTSFAGSITLTAGTLRINSNDALGTGSFAINGGTITNTSGAGVTLSGNNAQTWGGDFIADVGSGTKDLNLGTGAVTLTGNRQINVSGTTSVFTVGGVIGDGGNGFSLTKSSGTGTMILTGNSTYSGGTTIGAGTISVSNIGNAGASGNLGRGNINIGSGSTAFVTLLYTGAGETTTKVINLSGTTGGATITQSGGGALIFSSDFTATGVGAKTLFLNGSTAGTGEISGKIVDSSGGATSVSKSGTGTWTLSGANTYIGATQVTGGTLLVNGSTASGSAVTVNGSGSTLGGTGTVGGSVNLSNTSAGGTLNPGPQGTAGTSASVGTLNVGSLTLSATNASTIHIDAFGTAASEWDKLVSAGAIALNSIGTLQVTIASGLTFNPGDTYVLLSGTSLTGTFNGIADNQTVTFSGYTFTADYTPTGFDLVAVPEPSTWIGAALALGAIGVMGRRRFAKKAETLKS